MTGFLSCLIALPLPPSCEKQYFKICKTYTLQTAWGNTRVIKSMLFFLGFYVKLKEDLPRKIPEPLKKLRPTLFSDTS